MGLLNGVLAGFKSIWLCDTEFIVTDGEHPKPVCIVATEFHTGETVRLWIDQTRTMPAPPFPTGDDSLIVAYFATAELGCFKALGWDFPTWVLDLYAEFRLISNGNPNDHGNGLLGALSWFGVNGISFEDKDSNRQLIMRGGPWTPCEKQRILDYCQSDVEGLRELLLRMWHLIDTPRAVGLRGRYSKALTQMEWTGVPIDVVTCGRIKRNWDGIQDRLIEQVSSRIPVFEGRTFKETLFAKWLSTKKIDWPLLESGKLALDESTFSEMSKSHPCIGILHEMRSNLAKLRLNGLTIGSDGRNRTILSPYASKTGRNQPSTNKFIFGNSRWVRSLIQSPHDRFLCYIDWTSQEIGIAAKLSNDQNMLQAYQSDPYIWFGMKTGVIPANATKESHEFERNLFKQTMLGVGYGMSEQGLAKKLNISEFKARVLLGLHRETFPAFWSWVNGAVNHALLRGSIHAIFGWRYNVCSDPNVRSLQNWPVQANAAEMMRLAACMLTEAGIDVCCPVHDAFLIEGPVSQKDEIIAGAQSIMAEASAIVLDGFKLRSEANTIHPGERLHDKRGREFYEMILGLQETCE
jgi:DNA polymerase I